MTRRGRGSITQPAEDNHWGEGLGPGRKESIGYFVDNRQYIFRQSIPMGQHTLSPSQRAATIRQQQLMRIRALNFPYNKMMEVLNKIKISTPVRVSDTVELAQWTHCTSAAVAPLIVSSGIVKAHLSHPSSDCLRVAAWGTPWIIKALMHRTSPSTNQRVINDPTLVDTETPTTLVFFTRFDPDVRFGVHSHGHFWELCQRDTAILKKRELKDRTEGVALGSSTIPGSSPSTSRTTSGR